MTFLLNPDPVVLMDRPAPHVARLLINRPDKRNAIDFQVREQLTQALLGLLGDRSTRAVVLGGVGGVFSAGGDVPSMRGLTEAQARERMQHIHVLCRLVASARFPVVSAMEGIAAGAVVGLALLGDCIVGGPGTRVMFPFFGWGWCRIGGNCSRCRAGSASAPRAAYRPAGRRWRVRRRSASGCWTCWCPTNT